MNLNSNYLKVKIFQKNIKISRWNGNLKIVVIDIEEELIAQNFYLKQIKRKFIKKEKY